MILMIKGPMPTDSKKLKALYADFNDTVQWKIIQRVDQVEKNRRKAQDATMARSDD